MPETCNTASAMTTAYKQCEFKFEDNMQSDKHHIGTATYIQAA